MLQQECPHQGLGIPLVQVLVFHRLERDVERSVDRVLKEVGIMANTTQNPKGNQENRSNPTMEKAKDVASQAYDKAKDVAGQAYDKAKDTASSVGGMVSNAASQVGKTAENLTSSAASGLRNLGDTIRENAPHEGMLGNASQAVANSLRDSGRYLEEAGLSGIGEDLTEMIRRNPVPAVLVGVGIGFLLGRVLRS